MHSKKEMAPAAQGKTLQRMRVGGETKKNSKGDWEIPNPKKGVD